MTYLECSSCSGSRKQCITRKKRMQPAKRKKSEKGAVFSDRRAFGVRFPLFHAGKTQKPFAFSRAYDIVKSVNCNGGRFARQRGKSGLHRAGSPPSRRMPRGQPRGKESATENRPPGVLRRPARVKRRCKRPPGFGAIRAARQAPSGARPNRERCRCPRRYQFRVLAAQTDGRPRARARRQNPAYVAVHVLWNNTP